MNWNWQQPDWPAFTYDAAVLEGYESRFLLHSGEFLGAFRHIGQDEQDSLRIDLISDEALKTSEIEGELLNRDSVQSSLRAQFGIGKEQSNLPAAERGIAEMMADLYRTFAAPLSDDTVCAWHRMLMSGNGSIRTIGAYREHEDPMQVVSGPIGSPRIHFEAPPSATMPAEISAFVTWFNATAPVGQQPLPALTRAGIAHLYFVSIHPFEDGNGRIGRAIAEKSLAQNLGQPTLLALAYTIERKRKAYYAALEGNNKSTDITDWLVYFAETVLEAQQTTIRRVEFYIAKAKFYQRQEGQLNDRQQKAVARMFKEGTEGFRGGLSAENYITITKAARSTATRDLQDLLSKGALTKTGELRHTRYRLNLSDKTASADDRAGLEDLHNLLHIHTKNKK